MALNDTKETANASSVSSREEKKKKRKKTRRKCVMSFSLTERKDRVNDMKILKIAKGQVYTSVQTLTHVSSVPRKSFSLKYREREREREREGLRKELN